MKNATLKFKLHLVWSITMAIILFTIISSCKKDLVTANEMAGLPKKNTLPIKSITYADFIGHVKPTAMGLLAGTLSKTNIGQKNTTLAVSGHIEGQLVIDTDSLLKLTLGDTICYIFNIKPQTPRSVYFQNLTIQMVKGKTKAFLSTYLPDKKWIDAWGEKKFIKFSGSVAFNNLDLGSNDQSKVNTKSNSVSANPSTIKLLPGECEWIDVYTVVAMPRSTGDYPGHCRWETSDGRTLEDVQNINNGTDWLPYYTLQRTTEVNCAAPNIPTTGDGGGGGGGSTTPNPPGGYNPCDPVAVSSLKKVGGTSLLVAAPNPCDGSGGGSGPTPLPPSPATIAVQNLIVNLPVTSNIEQEFLSENAGIAISLNNYLNGFGWTQDNKEFVKWAVEYLTQYPNNFQNFSNIFFTGPKDLVFENVQILNSSPISIDQSDYSLSGLASNYFTEPEFNALVNSLENEVTEDPIGFYLLMLHKHSKLLNSSTYSKAGNQLKVGEYYLTPHYNSNNQLVFYAASRSTGLGIEYIIKASAINDFKDKYTTYKYAADLFYAGGKPNNAQLQLAAGDYWDGLVQSYKEAFSNPMYYVYLGHVFVGTATNLKTVPNSNQPIKVRYSSVTEPNARYPSIKIENMSRTEYMQAMSNKFNVQWQPLPNDPTKSRIVVGNRTYVSVPLSSSEIPSIYFTRNGKTVGKYRFNN